METAIVEDPWSPENSRKERQKKITIGKGSEGEETVILGGGGGAFDGDPRAEQIKRIIEDGGKNEEKKEKNREKYKRRYEQKGFSNFDRQASKKPRMGQEKVRKTIQRESITLATETKEL